MNKNAWVLRLKEEVSSEERDGSPHCETSTDTNKKWVECDVCGAIIGYYGTFDKLVMGLVENHIKTSQVKGLVGLMGSLKELESKITKLLEARKCTCRK